MWRNRQHETLHPAISQEHGVGMCTLQPPAVVLEKFSYATEVLLGLKRLAPRIEHFSVVGMQRESGLVQVDVPTLNLTLPIQHPRNAQLPDVDLGALTEKPSKLVQDPDLGETSTLGVGLTWGFKSSRFHPAVTEGSG